MVPAGLFTLLAPILFVEQLKEWLPGIRRSHMVNELSRFRLLVYLKMITFPPFSHRDAVVIGYGDVYQISPAEGESVVVLLRSCESPEYSELRGEVDARRRKEKNVPCELTSGFLLQPVGKNMTKISVICRVSTPSHLWTSKELDEGADKVQASSCLRGPYSMSPGDSACCMPSPQVDLKIAALPPSIFDFILKKLAANIIHMFAKEAAKYEAGGKVSVVACVSHVGPNCCACH
tara:strand:+ start:313 stop:1014 length:702 start_codon:yes stop_codon:yes gene_type:complete